jgi:hypothetical protein
MNANADADEEQRTAFERGGKVSLMLAVACELSPDRGKQYEESWKTVGGS